MDSKNHLDSMLAQKIAGRFACNHCGRKYRVRDITIVEKWEQQWLMQLVCAWCHAEELLSVLLKGQQARAVLLDVTPGEWKYFRQLPAVGVDDVIEMARTMRDYQGDLSEILEESLPADE